VDRQSLRSRLGIGEGKQAVLVAFSKLSLPATARSRLAALPGTRFLLPKPLALDLPNGIPVDPEEFPFPELVHAADAIVSKPGYGIVSDAIAAGVPLLVTERDDFPETPHLLHLLEKTIGLHRIGHEAFQAGDWETALAALPGKAVKQNDDFRIDGAETAARRIQEFLDIG
jgi:L-arabinokinase